MDIPLAIGVIIMGAWLVMMGVRAILIWTMGRGSSVPGMPHLGEG